MFYEWVFYELVFYEWMFYEWVFYGWVFMNEYSMNKCSKNECSIDECSWMNVLWVSVLWMNFLWMDVLTVYIWTTLFVNSIQVLFFFIHKRGREFWTTPSHDHPPPFPSRNHTTSLEDKFLFQLSIIACSQIVMLWGLNSAIHYTYLCSMCTRDSVKLLNNKS